MDPHSRRRGHPAGRLPTLLVALLFGLAPLGLVPTAQASHAAFTCDFLPSTAGTGPLKDNCPLVSHPGDVFGFRNNLPLGQGVLVTVYELVPISLVPPVFSPWVFQSPCLGPLQTAGTFTFGFEAGYIVDWSPCVAMGGTFPPPPPFKVNVILNSLALSVNPGLDPDPCGKAHGPRIPNDDGTADRPYASHCDETTCVGQDHYDPGDAPTPESYQERCAGQDEDGCPAWEEEGTYEEGYPKKSPTSHDCLTEP